MNKKELSKIKEAISDATKAFNKVMMSNTAENIQQSIKPEVRTNNDGQKYVHLKVGVYEVNEIVDTEKIEIEEEKSRAKKVEGEGGEIVDFSKSKDM